MSRAPAWWRRLRAWAGGWFWLPCPRCGEHFAGYEVWSNAYVSWQPRSADRIVCPQCAGKHGTARVLPW